MSDTIKVIIIFIVINVVFNFIQLYALKRSLKQSLKKKQKKARCPACGSKNIFCESGNIWRCKDCNARWVKWENLFKGGG